MTAKNNLRFFYKGVVLNKKTQMYVEKKLALLDKILKNILEIDTEIDEDKKGQFRVEIMVKTPYKKYRAEETSRTIESATDIVTAELKNQIAKRKGKRAVLKKRGQSSLKKKMVVDKKARF
jgi:ribosomal subunit interface protein